MQTGKQYRLSQEEIQELVKNCTQAGIDAYKKQHEDATRRKKKLNDRAYRMKEKLSCYRRVKKALADDWTYTEEERREYRLQFLQDLMGDPLKNSSRTEEMLLDREEKRRRDLYSIQQIDHALDLYRDEIESSGSEEEARRYRILKWYYISDPGRTVAEIAELENVSEKTVYRDINLACEVMYQYVVGM